MLIEHEYGIFGGDAGSYVLSLVRDLEQPFVVTLHTVLSDPTDRQAEVLRELCGRASLVTVFTETARRMIIESGFASGERIRVIPHGVPSLLLPPAADAVVDGRTALDERAPSVAHLEGRTVLSTFGLISAGKGIETVIEALPAIVAQHPDVLYLVAGQTHPEVVKKEGERYRLSLERLVRDHGLERHVQFLDRFLSEQELAFLLSSTDLVPHAVPVARADRLGRADLRGGGRLPGRVDTVLLRRGPAADSGAGVLVPFDDPASLAKAVLQLLDHPGELATAAVERASLSGLALPGRRWQRKPSTCCAWRSSSVRPDATRSVPAGWRPRRRSDRITCSPWWTTSVSSSTPTASCRTAPAGTASTTSPGWSSSPWAWIVIPTNATFARIGRARHQLPAPRVAAGRPGDAQLHVLRTALAGRPASR